MTVEKTITLNDGRQIPWLGFGTGTALFGRDASDLIKLAIDTGITHLDGAQVYRNEDTLGAGIKASGKPRSELYIVTKLQPLSEGQTVNVRQSLLESLEKLGLDYVDLFLIHSPAHANKEGKLQDIWRQFEEVQAEGLTKSIGVSNFRVEDLKAVLETAKVIPAVNQIELHPYVWKAASPIVEFDKQHGILTASYGGQTPVARVPGGPVDPVLASARERLEKVRGAPVTAGQVLSKWLLQKGAIVITTSSKKGRIEEFLDTEDVPDLTEDEIEAIDVAGATLHKRVYMRAVFNE